MFMRALLLAAALGSVSGCATKIENPTDYITYRNEPLVRQVKEGMTKEQVQAIGGRPSSIVQRSVHPGSCNNYILNHEGHQQAYHVSFGAAGRVQHSGFMTCRQREEVERQRLD